MPEFAMLRSSQRCIVVAPLTSDRLDRPTLLGMANRGRKVNGCLHFLLPTSVNVLRQ